MIQLLNKHLLFIKYNYTGIARITSGDSKDNPVIVVHKSPVKDENDWWIKDLKLRESDLVSLLNGNDVNDSIINATQCLSKAQFSEMECF